MGSKASDILQGPWSLIPHPNLMHIPCMSHCYHIAVYVCHFKLPGTMVEWWEETACEHDACSKPCSPGCAEKRKWYKAQCEAGQKAHEKAYKEEDERRAREVEAYNNPAPEQD